ncbi:MAG: PEP-CTERM sorting domain-containing protein [Phycisphaerae bacterium]|nr:PEP-CTERM sorting domain-containing protein [Phycisphaerae bacterium]
MKKYRMYCLVLASVGMVASPVLAGIPGPYTMPTTQATLAGSGGAEAGARDWGDPIKWDQLLPLDGYGGASWIDNDTPSDALTADDFLCTQTGYINDIEFNGWSYYGVSYLDSFRITFWTDVPATVDDASHPGTLLHECVVGPGEPVGWHQVDPVNDPNHFKINLPDDQWFYQEGTEQDPIIYWIGIQGVMLDDGYFDAFYWNFRERHEATWGDDAAFASDYFSYAPWANWGFTAGYGDPDLYEGTLPSGWTSADMSFRLSGTPEPSTLGLLGLGSLALIRRRRS